MLKWVLVAAFLLSAMVCIGFDFVAQRKLQERRKLVAQNRAELQTLHEFYRQVELYEQQKGHLQRRIDVINHLKQNQKTAADAIPKLSTLDAASVESAAVVDGKDLLIYTKSGRILR